VSFCFRPYGDLPLGAIMLAQKNALELLSSRFSRQLQSALSDHQHFLENDVTANVKRKAAAPLETPRPPRALAPTNLALAHRAARHRDRTERTQYECVPCETLASLNG